MAVGSGTAPVALYEAAAGAETGWVHVPSAGRSHDADAYEAGNDVIVIAEATPGYPAPP